MSATSSSSLHPSASVRGSGGPGMMRSPALSSAPSGASSAASSSSSTSSSSSSSSRPRKSLLQSMGPLNIPVPPTLQNSPHLHSPNSVFRRPYNANRTPGEDEERWLGDTVPIPSSATATSGAHAHAHPSGTGHIHALAHGGRNANLSGHGHGHTMTKGPGGIPNGHAHAHADYFDRTPGHEGSSSREAKLLSAMQQTASRT